MKHNSRFFLFTLTAIIIGALFVWFFNAHYCHDAVKESVYDRSGNLLKLEEVVMVLRHGMRTPSEHIFNHNVKSIYYAEGYGQLTKDGKKQLYKMGRSMRRYYYDFITPYSKLISDDVKAVATNIERCFESVALLLAGLYPPEGRQIWNRKIMWQAVPITTITPDKAYILMTGPSSCPLYYELLNLANDTNDETEKLIGYLSNYVNFSDDKETKMRQLFVACDTIVSEIKMNIPPPNWIQKIYPDLVIQFLKDNFSYMSRNRKLQRLLSGPLLADIVSQMKKVVLKTSFSKINLYSGHDTTVSSLLNSFGLSAFIVPDYGAAVIFELYSSHSGEYYVKILYNEDTSFSNIETKVLPGCEELCPLDKFIIIIQPLCITEHEWKKECSL